MNLDNMNWICNFVADKLKQHFVEPDSYQVTWWPKDAAHGEINSQQTKDDHLLITGLKSCTTYNVVVESRKLQSYADIQGKHQAILGI